MLLRPPSFSRPTAIILLLAIMVGSAGYYFAHKYALGSWVIFAMAIGLGFVVGFCIRFVDQAKERAADQEFFEAHEPLAVRGELVDLLTLALKQVENHSDNFEQAIWPDKDSALAELFQHIKSIEKGQTPDLDELDALLSPTGALHNVAEANSWSSEHAKLSQNYQALRQQIVQLSI